MKTQIITLLCCILCNWAIAQQQPNTIKVNARVVYVDPEPTFKATVSISSAFSSFDNDMMSLNQMKEHFKKTLEDNGLSWNNIKKHKGTFGFETMGYKKEGAIYEYETSSAEAMKIFLNIKLPILYRLDATSVIELDNQEAEKITRMALEKAAKKATFLTKAMKRQLGKILSIEQDIGDLVGKPFATTLYYDRIPGEFFYDVTVVYELK